MRWDACFAARDGVLGTSAQTNGCWLDCAIAARGVWRAAHLNGLVEHAFCAQHGRLALHRVASNDMGQSAKHSRRADDLLANRQRLHGLRGVRGGENDVHKGVASADSDGQQPKGPQAKNFCHPFERFLKCQSTEVQERETPSHRRLL